MHDLLQSTRRLEVPVPCSAITRLGRLGARACFYRRAPESPSPLPRGDETGQGLPLGSGPAPWDLTWRWKGADRQEVCSPQGGP